MLCTDTVGFINNLPHEFVEAFASTLEESVYSDLILHVVDISNPDHNKHIDVTNSVLKKLGCESPVIMVYNKIDKVNDLQIEEIKDTYDLNSHNVRHQIQRYEQRCHYQQQRLGADISVF